MKSPALSLCQVFQPTSELLVEIVDGTRPNGHPAYGGGFAAVHFREFRPICSRCHQTALDYDQLAAGRRQTTVPIISRLKN
jgi:hypothetical protein